jgi:hypothetical protein
MSATHPQNALLGLLGWRLVRLIETHSEQLARGLLARIQDAKRCRHYVEKVTPEELQRRVYEIYRHLGEWLLKKNESDVERRYMAIGERRASQGVALSQLIFVIITTKEHLWEYAANAGQTDRAFELFQELKLFQLIGQFFDRAAYFAAIGYERYLDVSHRAAAG